MISIDLNCDMGESFGAWRMGSDAEIMNYVSSVNVACGFHAGDATVMRQTVEAAAKKNIAIGAHPSFPDLQGFGRREMKMSEQEIFDVVIYQISALSGICRASGAKMRHVKPHGALYNSAAINQPIAAAIVRAVKAFDETLSFYGLSSSYLISEAEKIKLKTVSEVFADRTYQTDGTLTPRVQANALIENERDSIAQILQMIKTQTVTTVDGQIIPIKAETVCIHGDAPRAARLARAIRQSLIENNIKIGAV